MKEASERIEAIRKRVAEQREHDHPVCQALRSANVSVVREFVRSMFDYELSDEDSKRLFVAWKGRKNGWTLSTGPAMWIKNRLLELGCFRTERNPPLGTDELATAVLHVFFVSLEETAEMIAFLQNEQTEEQQKKLASVARSKLFGTPRVVTPIDSTAAKIAKEH